MDNLNESQRLAVTHGEGPLLILAGAGTGKTRVLTQRIAHLIDVQKIAPSQIMAVTFTRKAAHEMATRLERLLNDPLKAREIHIGTFHALSGGLLREAAGTAAEPELLTEAGQMDLIKKVLQDQGLTGTDWQPLEVLRRISLAKGRLLYPEDLASDDDPLFATAYGAYQCSLREGNYLDFDDLIGLLLERWRQDGLVLAGQQSKFAAILVDEFQDVNEAQYRWLKLLTAPHRNLCVVGDSDQSIYAFRGSHVGIFQRFQEDFPEALVVKLQQNYRSSQHILEAASAVIAHNSNPLTCELWSESGQGPLLRLGRLADEAQEGSFVVSEIERLVGGSSHYQIYRGSDADTPEHDQYSFADFAVLYRTHAQSRPLVEALDRAGIPFQVVGEKAPFATRAADTLLSYLRFATDTTSVRDFQTIFNLPPRGLGEKAQQWLAEQLDQGTAPGEILLRASKNLKLPIRHQAAMDRLRRTTISLQGALSSRPLAEVLEVAMEETGLREHFEEAQDSARESFRWLLLLAASYGKQPAAATLPPFLHDLAQWRAGDFFDPRADAVALMTLHAAKGLEFPVVFICGLDQGVLPLTRKNHGEEGLEEERRLFYVAMTRAHHRLTLTTVRRRFLFGEVLQCSPSPFIREIPDRLLEEASIPPTVQRKKPKKEKQLTLF